MNSLAPVESDPRAVPRSVEREVLRASVAARLFAEDSPVKVGRFVIIERAGSGGMGVVYRAYDPELEREVALKLLHSKPEQEQERLVREARAAARVVHPNVVSIFEVGTHGSDLFVAMEYIAGSTLRAWGDEGRAPHEIVAMHVEAGRGLVAAHAAGVIHRDYKPDNVLIGTDGRPRVADFGLARSAPPPDDAPSRPNAEILSTLSGVDPRTSTPRSHAGSPTATGDVLGTPAYMAPEQFLTSAIDERADQYSFCVTLFEALTGARPFAGRPSFARDATPEVFETTRLDRRVRAALQRGLALDPEDRFESMQALLDALTGPPRGRRIAIMGGTAAVLGALALGAALRTPPTTAQPVAACDAMGDAFDRQVAPGHVDRLLEQVETWGLEPVAVVTRRIQAQRTTWVEVAEQACTEFHLERATTQSTFDAKMDCLHSEAAQLDLTLGIASGAPHPTRVLPVLGSSTGIIDCGNQAVVLGRAAARVRDEPRDVAVLRERFERTETEAVVHGRAELIPKLEADEAEARTLSSPLLQAETGYELASAYTAAGRYDEAERLLLHSYRLARVSGDVDLAVDIARFLANFLTAYRDGRHAEARVWNEIALAEVDDPRVSTYTAAATLISTSHIQDMDGEAHSALATRHRAATLLHERHVPETDQLSLKAYSELAAAYHELARYELAEQLYRMVIEARLETYPHDRSGNAGILLSFGRMLHDLGRHDEAMVYLERGHASVDKEGRPLRWVQATTDLVDPLLADGQGDRAQRLLTEAGEVLDRSEGSRRDRSHLLDGWAALHESRDELALALERSEEATAIALEATPHDPATASMHLRHARLLGRADRGDEARDALTRARSLLSPRHPAHADVDRLAAELALR